MSGDTCFHGVTSRVATYIQHRFAHTLSCVRCICSSKRETGYPGGHGHSLKRSGAFSSSVGQQFRASVLSWRHSCTNRCKCQGTRFVLQGVLCISDLKGPQGRMSHPSELKDNAASIRHVAIVLRHRFLMLGRPLFISASFDS
jgi:hypothetical protein